MKQTWFAYLAALLIACVSPPAHATDAGTRTIFAAASLSEALAEVAASLPVPPRLSFGGSGAMARQVDHGAPADVVILASPIWMDWLEDRGRLQPGTRSAPFGNQLVLIAPHDSKPLQTLTKTALLERLGPSGRLAMGEHRAVPAGQYSAEWLRARGIWDDLRPHLAETENVRAALALVSRGEAQLGLVYASDLVAAPEAATIVWTIPAAEQPDIRYAMAALTPEGAALADALTTPAALAIFARYGFTIRASE